MSEEIFHWFNTTGQIAEWITAITAVVAVFVAVREFLLKRRPFIDIEIQVAENQNKDPGGWLFYALLTNKGTYPGMVRVTKTIMRVGDEEYPSEIKNTIFVSPGEGKKTALIGSIYDKGIKKIRGHEYRSNRVELEIEIISGDVGSKKFKYKMRATYQVDVSGDKPTITLVEEDYA